MRCFSLAGHVCINFDVTGADDDLPWTVETARTVQPEYSYSSRALSGGSFPISTVEPYAPVS
jgi:hypothetical protein